MIQIKQYEIRNTAFDGETQRVIKELYGNRGDEAILLSCDFLRELEVLVSDGKITSDEKDRFWKFLQSYVRDAG